MFESANNRDHDSVIKMYLHIPYSGKFWYVWCIYLYEALRYENKCYENVNSLNLNVKYEQAMEHVEAASMQAIVSVTIFLAFKQPS